MNSRQLGGAPDADDDPASRPESREERADSSRRPPVAEGPRQESVFHQFDEMACEALVRRVEALRSARHEADEFVESRELLLCERTHRRMAFGSFRRGFEGVVVVDEPIPDDEDIWFVGDLHGDLLALEAALQCISEVSPGPHRIVFLGDLFDDGDDGLGVLVRVLMLALESDEPQAVLVLAGNHDVALRRGELGFDSSVSPADFAAWLNRQDDQALAAQIGQLCIDFFEKAPRALFLPDGLLAAHGGAPHSDLWAELTGRDAMNAPRCLEDFVWTRAHERARKRVPNRASRGCEFGYEDFFQFCQKAKEALGQPVERMVRGHDHVEQRFAIPERYDQRLLTINTMSHRLPRELGGPYERTPCIAKWLPGKLPCVYRLGLCASAIRRLYPEPTSANESAGRSPGSASSEARL